MNILVINSGSSSIKWKLIKNSSKPITVSYGMIDAINTPQTKFTFSCEKKHLGIPVKIKNHEEGLKLIMETLIKYKIISSLKDINAIGHRVVHGGEKYVSPAKIDAKVIKEIEKLSELAPLHNPANLKAILALKKMMPKIPQVAVFDTAFYQTMNEKAYTYALPKKFTKDLNIKKFGFHGISHKYVVEETLKILKNKNAKIITCHLGNGISITSSVSGKAVDTTMGFSPLEGVMMGSRSGSIDPSIIFYAMKKLKLKADAMYSTLNNESGLKAVSEISGDMRLIYKESLKNNQRAIFTIEMFSYQIAKHIGALISSINGLNALVFSAGLGEKAFYVRALVCSYLEYMGIKLDKKKNEKSEPIISDKNSKIKVFVIPTDEELEIAKEVSSLLTGK